MTEEEAKTASKAERPMLVYVYRDADERTKDGDDPRAAIEQDKAFSTDKVAVGARFFDCLRISAADAAKDRALAGVAKKAPCLAFVRPGYEVAATLRGRLNAGKVFQAMCKTMRLDYANCVATALKKQKSVEKERTKLQRDKDALARLDAKLADARGGKKTRLAKEREELDARIGKVETVLREREDSLFELKPKA